MELKEIYRPIIKELTSVEEVLKSSLSSSSHKPILEMGDYVFSGGGKRLRPALVLLSAKAACPDIPQDSKLVDVAAAIELIHLASLVHDDIIDNSCLRHSKPTINHKFREDVAIAFGDYLYSVAFELISTCKNRDILQCISSATKAMCEGELLQVCQRGNLKLLREHYFIIVKKKTAALFASCCHAGTLLSGSTQAYRNALKTYGFNFGIAFQITDDYLDLAGEQRDLGKDAGRDITSGELTLPLLNLLESVSPKQRPGIRALLFSKGDRGSLGKIKERFFNSSAPSQTKDNTLSYVNLAKQNLEIISDSSYKHSLFVLADYVVERGFSG